MARVVSLRLRALLRNRALRTEELAKRLDCSQSTVRGLINNTWSSIDRRILERLLDEFDCGPQDLFEVGESPFFDLFRRIEPNMGKPRCRFVVPRDPAALTHRDEEAVSAIRFFLRDNVPDLADFSDAAETADRLHEFLNEGCCVVFGAPGVNRAAELAICEVFGAPPWQPMALELSKLPFAFCDPRDRGLDSAVLTRDAGDGHESGIFLNSERMLIPSAVFPSDDFQERELKDATDAGLVLVHNWQTPSGARRKLIVLAGITRIGTEAAARAVVADYRDLEPLEDESTVWGIVEGVFDKPRRTTARTYRSQSWIVRIGGRNPTKPPKRKQPASHTDPAPRRDSATA